MIERIALWLFGAWLEKFLEKEWTLRLDGLSSTLGAEEQALRKELVAVSAEMQSLRERVSKLERPEEPVPNTVRTARTFSDFRNAAQNARRI